jgi:tRNA pseudouridine38-40 synthase
MSADKNQRNIKLIISYDGTDYAGWEVQKGLPTIQGELESALEKIHKHPVGIVGSGRTDAGVHARAQAANFRTGISAATMEARRFVPALNSLLPQSIRIAESCEAPPDFHARFDAKSRLYRYFFVAGRGALPAEKRFVCELRRVPDIALLNDYCRYLRGEFDCTVFAAAGDKSKSRFRYIYNAVFLFEAGKLVFEIRANAFLWNMVRSVAGTLLFCEERKMPPEEFFRIASSGRRELAGPTLPPQGLFLWEVGY